MQGWTDNRGRRFLEPYPPLAEVAPGWRLLVPLFDRVLDRIDRGIVTGTLDLTLPDGTRRLLGRESEGEPYVLVELRSWRALVRLVTRGSAGWYEGWRAHEWWAMDEVALFELFVRNRATLGGAARARGPTRLLKRIGHRLRRNSRAGSSRNIEFHYDLGNDFYQAWLDPSLTYSSALFEEDGEPLEQAQRNKLGAMLERTGTGPGDTILEIGCGWGSFAEHAAHHGRKVHGITLSHEQKRLADERLVRFGEDARISLTDYRDVAGSHDAVVSIEMVEAVGQEYWPAYLDAIARALKPGGRAAIQFISMDDATFDAYARNVDFIQRYVFPGGMLVSERRFRALAEARGLRWEDRRGFGLHYSETLRQWRERFYQANREGSLPDRLREDGEFLGLWAYYLMYCEGGFRGGGIDVAQVTLVKEG